LKLILKNLAVRLL